MSRYHSFEHPVELKEGMVFAIETYWPTPGRLVGGPDRGGGRRHRRRLRAADPVPGRPAVRGGHPPVHRRRHRQLPERDRVTRGDAHDHRTERRLARHRPDGQRDGGPAHRRRAPGHGLEPDAVQDGPAGRARRRGSRGTIAELAGCEMVFTMVTGPADLERGHARRGRPAHRRARGRASWSTARRCRKQASARIRAAAAAAGAGFLAAPVCGNPEVFAEGQGSFIVSGPARHLPGGPP